MPRVLWLSQGDGPVLMSEVHLSGLLNLTAQGHNFNTDSLSVWGLHLGPVSEVEGTYDIQSV